MATRNYTNVNITGITDESESNNASLIFDVFNFSGSGSQNDTITTPATSVNTIIWARRQGSIDFAGLFPTIPASALISRVRLTGTIVGTANQTVTDEGTSSISSNTAADYSIGFGPFLTDPDWAIHVPPYDFTEDADAESGDVGSFSAAASGSIDIDIPHDPPLTRSELIELYGTVYLNVNPGTDAALVGGDGLTANQTVIASLANWNLEITYTVTGGSYYIKPTPTIVNGLPVSIIADEDEDIALIDDEDVPEGYIFYGDAEDFPDGPTFLWWSSPDFYEFYIFSPITPSLGGFVWTSSPTPPSGSYLSLTLGSLDVLVADASGIYVLQANKRNDTLYDRASEDTINVKIPDPMAETGFIP